MSIEEVFATLEDLHGVICTFVHDIEDLASAEMPHVDGRPTLHDQIYEIEYTAKKVRKFTLQAMTRAEEAMNT